MPGNSANQASSTSCIRWPSPRILAELRLDARTVAAALLHDVAEDTVYEIPDLDEEFGAEVAGMVDGVTKLVVAPRWRTYPRDIRDPKVESLRKLHADDGQRRARRADQAGRPAAQHAHDGLHAAEDKQRRISRETLDIYAPLASVLGMYQLKWELEDLAFRFLEPDVPQMEMSEKFTRARERARRIVAGVMETLRAELARHDIQAMIKGRPKHLYSIWRKMKRKGVTFEQVYDRLGCA